MRLAQEIANELVKAVTSSMRPPHPSELFLFGSRTDDQKKGGDIDLLLVTDLETKKRSLSTRIQLISELRRAARDQKVDLSVTTPEEMKSNPFFASIDKLVSLGKW